MNAGELDKYIEIQRPTQTTGALNAVSNDWVFLSNAWAKKITPSAKEIRQGKEVQIDKVVWMMYETDILNSDQIIHDSKTYHVESVIEKGFDLIVTTKLVS